MKNVKHTPGPWRYLKQSNEQGEPVFTVGAEAAEGENKHIARVAFAAGWSDVTGKTHRATRPAEANARLIAAAPELLTSALNCTFWLSCLEDLNPDNIGIIEEMREALQFVIAKATGGAE